MATVRNRATPDGFQLGECLARFADEAEPQVRLDHPAFPVRCGTCAFRKGTKPNGMALTLMSALKALLEKDNEFHCHEHDREGTPCAGWAMLMLTNEIDPVKVPWDYAEEAERPSKAPAPESA